MSQELRVFLTEKGVATSRTTSYNPAGNGQVERYNGTIWKAITMCLKSKNLPIKYWQNALPDELHSTRSLLCTATNETPHERFLGFSRRSSSGSSVPSWLTTPGPVFIKRQVRTSKTDPLVDEVELLQANPHYAHVRSPDGRETTVATKQLAPRGQEMSHPPSQPEPVATKQLAPRGQEMSHPPSQPEPGLNPDLPQESTGEHILNDNTDEGSPIPQTLNEQPPLRRSERTRRPVDRLNI